MIDSTQLILLFVIVVLTVLLLILGIQVFFILRELRKSIFKMNKVLDDASSITESVSEPISSLSSIVSGVKTGAMFAQLLKGKTEKGEKHGKE